METSSQPPVPGFGPAADEDSSTAVSVGSSPFAYSNVTSQVQIVRISGGIISIVEVSRDGTTFYTFLTTIPEVLLGPGDRVRVTFTLLPVMTVYPL